jgi:23S rRNA pseudouridine1911/1915/1917 synthase
MTAVKDQTWDVSGKLVGLRLDLALVQLAGVSRSEAKRALEEGRVTLAGWVMRAKDKGRLLEAGDKLILAGFLQNKELSPVACQVPGVTVLGEGEGWIGVYKPSGVGVHPLEAGETGTVLNHVALLKPQIVGVGEGGLRSGVVHRLDVETSGVLLFAYKEEAWKRLRLAFKNRQTQKLYRVMVEGKMPDVENVRLELDLTIGSHHPAKVKVVPEEKLATYKASDVRRCAMVYSVIRVEKNRTLVEVDLETGFLHQVRVMMAHMGHPVVNDPVYGDREPQGRLMLHARELIVPEVGVHLVSEADESMN